MAIVGTEDGLQIPATVIGFGDLRSEEPNAFRGKTFVYAYDQCRVVDRENDEWKALTQTGDTAQGD